MFDSPLATTVTVVMFVGFVLIAIALPPLKICSDEMEHKLAASKQLNLDDDQEP
jgi:hypothetical protein